MRHHLLAAAAMLSLAAGPAFAQSATQTGTSATQPVGAPTQKGPMGVEPAEIVPGHDAKAAATSNTDPAGSMPGGSQPMSAAAGNSGMTDGMPGHEPMSTAASNNSPADTRSEIAPKLPDPGVGPNATAADFLRQAQVALQQKRSGEAQEALERAETRLLDRSTVPDAAGRPDDMPAIRLIGQARDALGRRDWSQANDAISQAIKAPLVTQEPDANGPS